MAVYEYTACDQSGSKFSGTYDDISSVSALRVELAKMGDTLIKARPKKTQSVKKGKVRQDEIVTFAYKLAEMCSAGLSIIRSLDTIEQQTENRTFKAVIGDVRSKIERGSTLKGAFEPHRELFSDFFLGMVEAGESGGRLSESLKSSAVYLEKNLDFKRKVKSAFAYPIIVGIMCLVVINSMVIFVVPVFAKLYRQLRVELPLPTAILMKASTLARTWWWLIPFFVAAIVLAPRLASKNRNLKDHLDRFKLNIPLLAGLNRMILVSRFIRTFSMLISAGVSLVKALDVANAVVNNVKFSQITRQLQKSIEAGNSVAQSLQEHDIFPSTIVQLAASGEEAGRLSEMLDKSAEFLEKDIERTLNALVVKIEPILTIIMGAIVGFVLMGVYIPMFDYMSHLK